MLLVNLAKGRIGEDSSSLLGGLLVTTLGLAAFSRAELPAPERRDFFVYVDEFQNFTTLLSRTCSQNSTSIGSASLSPTNIFISLNPDVRHAVLRNASTIISFRVGSRMQHI